MIIYEISITPITPIHIGTGEDLMPFSYTLLKMSPQGQNYKYVRFNDERLVSFMTPDQIERLEALIAKDDFPHLRQTYNEIACKIILSHQECIFYLAEITNEILNLWQELEKRSQNSFVIQPTICSLYTKKPYIPGSSIKGAIRTAILDPHVQEFAKTHKQLKEQDMLSAIECMRDQKYKAQADPLRALKITDAIFPARGSRIVGQLALYNRVKRKSENIAINEEVIKSAAISSPCEGDSAEPITTTTTIALDDRLINKHPFKITPRSFQEIADRCNEFYETALNKEYELFYRDAPDELYNGYKYIDDAFSNLNQDREFMVRLGRHSQIEYLTFSTERAPGKKAFGTKTRTLFKYKNMLLPMGWARCALVSEKEA